MPGNHGPSSVAGNRRRPTATNRRGEVSMDCGPLQPTARQSPVAVVDPYLVSVTGRLPRSRPIEVAPSVVVLCPKHSSSALNVSARSPPSPSESAAQGTGPLGTAAQPDGLHVLGLPLTLSSSGVYTFCVEVQGGFFPMAQPLVIHGVLSATALYPDVPVPLGAAREGEYFRVLFQGHGLSEGDWYSVGPVLVPCPAGVHGS